MSKGRWRGEVVSNAARIEARAQEIAARAEKGTKRGYYVVTIYSYEIECDIRGERWNISCEVCLISIDFLYIFLLL